MRKRVQRKSVEAAGEQRQDLTEALEGAEVAFGGRGRRDVEHLGGLRARQALEVAKRQHLAVDRVHPVQRFLEPELAARHARRLRSGDIPCRAVARPARPKTPRESHPDRARPPVPHHACDGPGGPGGSSQAMRGEITDPEEERHARLAEILRQAREGVDVGLLEHV